MSLSFILFALIVAGLVAGFLTQKLNLIYEDGDGNTKIKIKPIFVGLLLMIMAFAQPFNYEVINVGYKGLLIDKWGEVRGASGVIEKSGVVFYNKYSQDVEEIPLDLRTMVYDKMSLTAKGGFPLDVAPSFTYRVKNNGAALLFTDLRSQYRNGGLENIENDWLSVQVFSSLSAVASKYGIEAIFNDRVKFESEVVKELNKTVGKYFEISGFKSNTVPDSSILGSIKAKAKADADIIRATTLAEVAKADADRKIQIAKGDSAAIVIEASAVAEAMKLKKEELSPIYIDYLRYVDIAPTTPRVPSTVLGSNANAFVTTK